MTARMSTAAWAAALLFIAGAYGGIEVARWGIDREAEQARNERAVVEPVACIQPIPYLVAERESCTEVARACYARKRQERVKPKSL